MTEPEMIDKIDKLEALARREYDNQRQAKTNRSAALNELATALNKAQAAIKPALKDSNNPAFRSKYADLASVWEAIREPMTANGLSVVQMPESDGETISVTTMLLHTSGQWISSTLTMRPVDNKPQTVGSCTTYARRYALSAMLGVAPDDDDDANSASGVSPSPAVRAATSKPRGGSPFA